MSMLTVRDLDPAVKDKLRQRAARHGQSMEAEVRQILTHAVNRDEPVSILDSIRRHFSGADSDLELPDRQSAQQREINFES